MFPHLFYGVNLGLDMAAACRRIPERRLGRWFGKCGLWGEGAEAARVS